MKSMYLEKEVREIGGEFLEKKGDNFYEIEKHLFGQYYVRVQFAVKTAHPINGQYRVGIIWKKMLPEAEKPSDEAAYGGLIGDFDEDGVFIETVQRSPLDVNIRNITHLKGNDNYWYALNKCLRTLMETYHDVMGDVYDSNKYLLD